MAKHGKLSVALVPLVVVLVMATAVVVPVEARAVDNGAEKNPQELKRMTSLTTAFQAAFCSSLGLICEGNKLSGNCLRNGAGCDAPALGDCDPDCTPFFAICICPPKE